MPSFGKDIECKQHFRSKPRKHHISQALQANRKSVSNYVCLQLLVFESQFKHHSPIHYQSIIM